MDYALIVLSRKELHRLRQIVSGDTTAANTLDEDRLFREGLVAEKMLVSSCGVFFKTDMRAVVPTEDGKRYLALYDQSRKRQRQETGRFWVATIVAVLSLIATVISVLLQIN